MKPLAPSQDRFDPPYQERTVILKIASLKLGRFVREGVFET
jgi:hypothetical protein